MTPFNGYSKRPHDVKKFVMQCVEEFHAAFKLPRYTDFNSAPDEIKNLRIALMNEEYREFTEAKDVNSLYDAFCDMVYIAAGHLITYSIEPNWTIENTVESPDEIEEAEVEEADISEERHRAHVNDMQYHFAQIAAKASDPDTYKEALDAAIAAAMSMFPAFVYAFHEVHESNMKKLWDPEEVKKVPAGWTITPTLTSKDVEVFIVRDQTGKVRKPPTWAAPDLRPYV